MEYLIAYLRAPSSSSSAVLVANLKVRFYSIDYDRYLIIVMQRQIEEGVVSPHLAMVKATLLSMLPLFIPPRYYNEITLGLARRSTEVAICISKLIEQRETPSLVEDVSELEE